MDFATVLNTKLDAWLAGKNPWITLPTGDKKTPFKRVRAKDMLGDPRIGWYYADKKKGSEKEDPAS